jgi:hypothetical protein|tara:strand:+ start:5450 stop:5608 length:159 start_codon:yes stop_codon:yes gene_type:complete
MASLAGTALRFGRRNTRFLLKKLGFVGVFPGIRIEDSRILGVLFHWVKKLYL